jgi:ribosomal protein S24E
MTITIRAKRIRVNKLLARKEIVLEVFHEGKPNVSHT